MQISFKKGIKGRGDRVICMTSQTEEHITIFKIAELVNQVAVNELLLRKVNKQTWDVPDFFFFRNAILEAVNHAILNIDWAEPVNENHIRRWCKEWMVSFESIEKELRKTQQARLDEYAKENR